jgi:hypothetical protein
LLVVAVIGKSLAAVPPAKIIPFILRFLGLHVSSPIEF